MNFGKGKKVYPKQAYTLLMRLFPYSLTFRSYCNKKKKITAIETECCSSQSLDFLIEGGRSWRSWSLSCGELWFVELSIWHPSTVFKIHFGFWVCFSVNQLPISLYKSFQPILYESFHSSKVRLYRLFPDLLSQLFWQYPKLWTPSGRKPAQKRGAGGRGGQN